MSRGSHLYVACRSVCDRGWQKVCLITWSFPSEALDHLIFKVKLKPLFLIIDFHSLAVGHLDSWIGSQKEFWSLYSIWYLYVHAVGFSTGWVRGRVTVRDLDVYVCGDHLVFDCLHSVSNQNWTVGKPQNEANHCVLTHDYIFLHCRR